MNYAMGTQYLQKRARHNHQVTTRRDTHVLGGPAGHGPAGGDLGEADLDSVMASLAAGDVRAYEPFFEMAAVPVRRILRNELGSKGIWVDRDRLDDLVGDCILELIRLAPRWRADGGAKPWNWAYRRLLRVAYAGLGLFTDDLEAHRAVASTADRSSAVTDNNGVLQAFELITEINRTGRTLGRALERMATDRDRLIWLDVLQEQGAGNKAPAVTVAQSHGLTEVNVRKICQRVRQRLTQLAASDPEYAVLLDLPAVAAA